MADPLSQQDRIGKLTTPAGDDKFVVNRFEATEAMGGLFEFRIGALSLEENFNLDSLIGKNCNVRIKAVDGLERHFNGVLTEANYTGGQYELFGYQFVLRPWLHLLSKHLGLPHLLQHEAEQDHQEGVQRPRLHRFSREPEGRLPDAQYT